MLPNSSQCGESDELIILCHRGTAEYFCLNFFDRCNILSLNSYANSHCHALLLSAVNLCAHSLTTCLQVCVNGSYILNNQRRLFLLTLVLSASDVHPNLGPALLYIILACLPLRSTILIGSALP